MVESGVKISLIGFGVIFLITSLLILGVFVFIIVRIVKNKRYNDSQPRLTVKGKVVSKRMEVFGENSSTYYYVTFEFDSGDRKELTMTGAEFGMLVEGDVGQLTFQGNRYLDFKRGGF